MRPAVEPRGHPAGRGGQGISEEHPAAVRVPVRVKRSAFLFGPGFGVRFRHAGAPSPVRCLLAVRSLRRRASRPSSPAGRARTVRFGPGRLASTARPGPRQAVHYPATGVRSGEPSGSVTGEGCRRGQTPGLRAWRRGRPGSADSCRRGTPGGRPGSQRFRPLSAGPQRTRGQNAGRWRIGVGMARNGKSRRAAPR